MTKSQLTKIEKQIVDRVRIPERQNKGGKFVVDVKRLSKLATKINQYEASPNVAGKR